jgi:hypothetical protein
VPVGALPGTGLEGTTVAGSHGVVRLAGSVAGELLGARMNAGLSWYSPRKSGSRTLTIGATGGCNGCSRGLMIGRDRTWMMRGPGPDSTNKTWLGASLDLGLGRAAEMTSIGARLGISAIQLGLPRGAVVALSPGVAYGAHLYTRALVQSELGNPVDGMVVGSLGGSLALPAMDTRRLSLGVSHLFVTGAKTTIGLAFAW